MNIKQFFSDKKRVAWMALGLMAAAFAAYCAWPVTDGAARRSAVLAESRQCYALPLDKGDTLFLPLREAWHAPLASWRRDSVETRVLCGATFVTPEGHAVAVDTTLAATALCPDTLGGRALQARLARLQAAARAEAGRLRDELTALRRYAERHSVVDDGYNEVMAYYTLVQAQALRADTLLALAARATKAVAAEARAYRTGRYRLAVNRALDDGRVASWGVAAEEAGRHGALLLVNNAAEGLPAGCTWRYVKPFMLFDKPQARRTGFPEYCEARTAALPQRLDSAAFSAALDGALCFNGAGRMAALKCADALVPAGDVRKLVEAALPLKARLAGFFCGNARRLRRAFARLVDADAPAVPASPAASAAGGAATNGAATAGDGRSQNVEAYLNDRLALRLGSFVVPAPQRRAVAVDYGDSARYVGQAVYDYSARTFRREGAGTFDAPDGSRYIGRWQADTLVSGRRIGSETCYFGGFDARLRQHGTGRLVKRSGERYAGGWTAGRRSGLGFSVTGDEPVRCGSWHNGRFKGERMVYTPERVYGIDISRYQHEIGRKVYPINWRSLRITSLGKGRRIMGKADYPVSFVYIKSTEGKSVVNRYYAADLKAARACGIRVGTYHFFSTGSTGAAQAAWFLRKSSVARGDLPPVLDVEPTDGQIKKMGGDAVLFREVEAWLRIVTQKTGRKPVLYVSQTFINDHMANASDYVRGHDVWVARYSEYKPYVHLLHWQLTPYGRVNGITGNVDINVFNGTKRQWDDYLAE